ncbi:hypothetical protein BRUCa_0876 [Brucella melitensis]|nr:hypothetical protein BAA13334_I02563 [Brucella abortus A13334]
MNCHGLKTRMAGLWAVRLFAKRQDVRAERKVSNYVRYRLV